MRRLSCVSIVDYPENWDVVFCPINSVLLNTQLHTTGKSSKRWKVSNEEGYWGREEGGGGGGGEAVYVWRWGEREIIYLSLHCHHQNDFCIKVGSDESHFNVS